ncbi:MAG: hypothetical protein BGP06_05055 [Rhizobiales bacterium 65-9]|nr:inositol monophosphatase [Hyphomicrobiales bacterium]OJY39253.1 MAG: hypothetical protein BGP06_05055 [Rhizobiales bacterium 65-9]
MSDFEITRRRYAAIGFAQELGALAMRYYLNRESLAVSMKGAQDFLTVADGAVEQRFREMIADAFPGDGVVGEEAGGANAENLWIIDPIDGTSNFARDNPHWCVSIGFLRRGVPEAGVIFAPVMNELYEAQRGQGARRNGKTIHPSGETDIGRATIEIGWSSRRPHEDYIGLARATFEAGAQAKRSASGALGVCYAADGRTDGYMELHINAWDVAAGVIIAREAGAAVSNFFSGDALTTGNPILVATPALAPRLAAMMGLEAGELLTG